MKGLQAAPAAVWHTGGAAQTTRLLPTQIPFWQASVCVQAEPSLQEAPFVLFVEEQTPVAGLQLPT